MKFNKHDLFIYIPLAIAAGYGGYLIIGYLKEKSQINPTETQKPAPQKVTSDNVKQQVQSAATTFPLVKGMTNDSIKQLQDILGVTPISGYFGDITLSALKEQTGKTQIDSQDDLIKTIQSILAADKQDPQRGNVAQNIVSTYKQLASQAAPTVFSGGTPVVNGNLYFSQDTTLHLQGQPAVMYIKKGKTLNLNNYVPQSVDSDNNLVLYCNNGDNQGTWIVDPSNITIQGASSLNQDALNNLYAQIKTVAFPDNPVTAYSVSDIPFLQAWYQSASNQESSFTFNGSSYSSLTGSPKNLVTPDAANANIFGF